MFHRKIRFLVIMYISTKVDIPLYRRLIHLRQQTTYVYTIKVINTFQYKIINDSSQF